MRLRRLAALGLAWAFGGAAAQPSPAPSAGFEAMAAQQVAEVARIKPPEFSLVRGEPGDFAFYGRQLNQLQAVRCERTATFQFIAFANLSGAIRVGVCTEELARARRLAGEARQGLQALLAELMPAGRSVTRAELAKQGLVYSRRTAGGAEEHLFPVLLVGHGVLAAHTVVLLPEGRSRAIIVQAETESLCKTPQPDTPLCGEVRQALSAIARRVESRAP